mmetsp:Transcript_46064/g.100084  ORF Transcript_46064/g.100084 Transcript_46064/m.100084 type:complete len:276 (-) Transcript_46064:2373-3200(-)
MYIDLLQAKSAATKSKTPAVPPDPRRQQISCPAVPASVDPGWLWNSAEQITRKDERIQKALRTSAPIAAGYRCSPVSPQSNRASVVGRAASQRRSQNAPRRLAWDEQILDNLPKALGLHLRPRWDSATPCCLQASDNSIKLTQHLVRVLGVHPPSSLHFAVELAETLAYDVAVTLQLRIQRHRQQIPQTRPQLACVNPHDRCLVKRGQCHRRLPSHSGGSQAEDEDGQHALGCLGVRSLHRTGVAAGKLAGAGGDAPVPRVSIGAALEHIGEDTP